MQSNKKVGVWIRVSTEDQAKGESPEHHEKRARMYAEVKQWEVAKVYHLEGVSGKAVLSHPEAKRMLIDVENGVIDGLIFSKIARLARNTRELLEIADYFKTKEADLISLEESIDTSSPAGRFFYTLLSAMAQWEREEIASRVKASIPIRAKMGKSLGGQAPYGYTWENKELVVNEDEAPIRKLMFNLFLKYKRKQTVVRELNDKGYRTRKGAKFSRTTLERLLTDPIAKGVRRTNYTESLGDGKQWRLKPQKEWITQQVPALVNEELWDQVNHIISEQKKKQGLRPLNRKLHLFTRYVKCHCGTQMHLPSSSSKYTCRSCKNKIEKDDLEEIYHHHLKDLVVSPEFMETYLSNSERDIKNKEQELGSLIKKRVKVKKDIDQLLKLNQKGEIPDIGFKDISSPLFEQLEQMKHAIPQNEGEIMAMKQQQLNQDILIQEAQQIFENWKNFTHKQKRAFIENATDNIIIAEQEVTINFLIDLLAITQPNPSSLLSENELNGAQNSMDSYLPPT